MDTASVTNRLPRSSGILLHVTSLPGPHGIGDVGPAAYRWIDQLAQAGQTWWQMLPLGPIARTYGDRLLAVGDAAGLVKATTGGGIYYSLLSGRLAADILDERLRDGDLTADSLAAYVRPMKASAQAVQIMTAARPIMTNSATGPAPRMLLINPATASPIILPCR